MKKFVALFMALMMLFSMAAMADVPSPGVPGGNVPSPGVPGGNVPSPGVPGGNVPSPGVPSPSVPSPSAPSFGTKTPVGEVSMGQVLWAAHGTKCFAIMTVALQDDVIVGAYIDEFQFMDAATAVGVPNSDSDFGTSFPEGKVLASKRVNSALYSANMASAGSTVALEDNYKAIEKFVVGMTVSELEATISTLTTEAAVDAVSGATLVDTLGYLQGLLAAAKAAK